MGNTGSKKKYSGVGDLLRGGVSLRVAFFLIFASAELRASVSLPRTPNKVQKEGVVQRVG